MAVIDHSTYKFWLFYFYDFVRKRYLLIYLILASKWNKRNQKWTLNAHNLSSVLYLQFKKNKYIFIIINA